VGQREVKYGNMLCEVDLEVLPDKTTSRFPNIAGLTRSCLRSKYSIHNVSKKKQCSASLTSVLRPAPPSQTRSYLPKHSSTQSRHKYHNTLQLSTLNQSNHLIKASSLSFQAGCMIDSIVHCQTSTPNPFRFNFRIQSLDASSQP
jgi:hypothetical protein